MSHCSLPMALHLLTPSTFPRKRDRLIFFVTRHPVARNIHMHTNPRLASSNEILLCFQLVYFLGKVARYLKEALNASLGCQGVPRVVGADGLLVREVKRYCTVCSDSRMEEYLFHLIFLSFIFEYIWCVLFSVSISHCTECIIYFLFCSVQKSL